MYLPLGLGIEAEIELEFPAGFGGALVDRKM